MGRGDGMQPLTSPPSVGVWGQVDALAVLLERGATKRRQCKEGRLALHYAAEAGHLDCVVMLLQHGTPVDHEDAAGDTALTIATWVASPENPRLHFKDAIENLTETPVESKGPKTSGCGTQVEGRPQGHRAAAAARRADRPREQRVGVHAAVPRRGQRADGSHRRAVHVWRPGARLPLHPPTIPPSSPLWCAALRHGANRESTTPV